MKRNLGVVVGVSAAVSVIAACSTSSTHRGIASFGDQGGWNKGVPWANGGHPDGWGGQFDRGFYNGPEGYINRFIPDNCPALVGNGPHASRKHHSSRHVASLNGPGPDHSQPPQHQPWHPGQPGQPGQPGGQPHPVQPQPQPQPQPVQPQPVQPQQPAFNAQAAIQSCEAGRMEAIQQARRATSWIGLNQGFMAAFDDGRREGMAQADPNRYGQGYQAWVNQTNNDASSRGHQIGQGEGSNQGSSDAVALFQSAVSPNGNSVPAANPQQNFNIAYQGIQTGWNDTGHATPDYSAIMQEWLNSNVGALPLPDAFGDQDHFRYGEPMFDRDHFREYWNNDGYWTGGYTYRVDRSDWDDDNDGWTYFSHGSQDSYFVQGYRMTYRWAAEFWYQVAFYQGANRGNPHDRGYDAGRWVQETYQERLGEMAGFNYAYARDSLAGYRSGYAAGYQNGYRNTYNDYASQPKITFNLLSLTSSLDSFVSGADVTANISFVNYGGKDAQIKVTSNSLDLSSGGSEGYTFGIGALQSAGKNTSALGKVPQGFVDGQSDTISVTVQQIFGGATTTLGSQSLSEILDSWAEIKGVSWAAPYDGVLQGKANLEVAVQNPLNYTTPGNVDLVGRFNGAEVGRLHLGQLSGKASTTQQLALSGLDPVACLSGGAKIALQLEMSSAGAAPTITSKASSTVGYAVDPSQGVTGQFKNRSYMAAIYFDGLVSSGASADQVKAASDMISSFADDEIDTANDNDTNLWGNAASAQETVIVQLGYAFKRHANVSQAVASAYEALGEQLIQKSAGKNIEPHGLFGKWNNRDGFRNAVKVFAPSAHNPD